MAATNPNPWSIYDYWLLKVALADGLWPIAHVTVPIGVQSGIQIKLGHQQPYKYTHTAQHTSIRTIWFQKRINPVPTKVHDRLPVLNCRTCFSWSWPTLRNSKRHSYCWEGFAVESFHRTKRPICCDFSLVHASQRTDGRAISESDRKHRCNKWKV